MFGTSGADAWPKEPSRVVAFLPASNLARLLTPEHLLTSGLEAYSLLSDGHVEQGRSPDIGLNKLTTTSWLDSCLQLGLRYVFADASLMANHAPGIKFVDTVNIIDGFSRCGGKRITRATLLQPLQASIVVVLNGAYPFRLD